MTHLSWPRSDGMTLAPELASQTRTVRSFEPETIRVPSGENMTAKITSSCPRSAGSTSAPEFACHTRIVQSYEPDTIRVPSGENATECSCSAKTSSNGDQDC